VNAVLVIGVPWDEVMSVAKRTIKTYQTEDLSDTPTCSSEIEYWLLDTKINTNDPTQLDPMIFKPLEIVCTGSDHHKAIIGIVGCKLFDSCPTKYEFVSMSWIRQTTDWVRSILQSRRCRNEPRLYTVIQS